MTNIYRSKAVILPIGQKAGGLSALASQFGGLAEIAGISVPETGSKSEILALLKSDILKVEVIKKYNLLPILFYEQWDKEKKTWKRNDSWIKKIFTFFQNKEEKEGPSIDDGIRTLSKIISVNEDRKLGTITVSVDYPDPEIAAKLVNYFLNTLREHMCKEAIRIAEDNKKTLEKELIKTSDPTIQQKLYSLIAKQIETITMAKVSENFAFKVIDPPRVPEKKYKPKRTLIVIVAFVSSLFFSVFLAFFLEYIKNAKRRFEE